MRKNCSIWTLAILILTACSILAIGGQRHSEMSNLLAQLRSDEWKVRATAFERLTTDRGGLSIDDVRNALVDLMDRENELIDSTFRASQGQEGTSVKYGEEYGEYYATLLGTVRTTASASRDTRTLQVLAHGSYNSDSPFAIWLGRAGGDALVSTLVEMSGSDIAPKRENAVAVLGRTLAEHGNHSLSEEVARQVRQTLLWAAGDDDAGVRTVAVRSIGLVRDRDAIPLLERIATEDPAAIPTANGERFPVREEARKALNAIKGES